MLKHADYSVTTRAQAGKPGACQADCVPSLPPFCHYARNGSTDCEHQLRARLKPHIPPLHVAAIQTTIPTTTVSTRQTKRRWSRATGADPQPDSRQGRQCQGWQVSQPGRDDSSSRMCNRHMSHVPHPRCTRLGLLFVVLRCLDGTAVGVECPLFSIFTLPLLHSHSATTSATNEPRTEELHSWQ